MITDKEGGFSSETNIYLCISLFLTRSLCALRKVEFVEALTINIVITYCY